MNVKRQHKNKNDSSSHLQMEDDYNANPFSLSGES